EDASTVRMLRRLSVPILTGHAITAVTGKGAVAGATLARLDSLASPVEGSEIRAACDLLIVATGADLMAGLLGQAGCRLEYDARLDRLVPRALAPGVYAAGQVNGVRDLEETLSDGRRAGAQAAQQAGATDASELVAPRDGSVASSNESPSPSTSPAGRGGEEASP